MDGMQLKNIRRDLRLTQEELAKKLGMSRNAIANYETEKQPVPRVVELAVNEIRRQLV
jgi:transcriptional regulator with XRE-family HTH domain